MSYPTEGPAERNAPEPQRPAAGVRAPKRPWSVTSAAVLAFVLAAFWLSGAIADYTWLRFNACYLRIGQDSILIGALLIWCGVRVLRGISSKSLFIAAVVVIAVNSISVIINVVTGGKVGHLSRTASPINMTFGLGGYGYPIWLFWVTAPVVLSVIIIFLLMRQSSTQFIRSRGGAAI